MSRIARPVADNSSSCDVIMAPPGGGANWSVLDETTPNDNTDFSEASLDENEIGCLAVDLDTAFEGPATHTDHHLEAFVFWTDTLGGFESPDLVISLWEGDPSTGTLIATQIHASITKDVWKSYAIALTESQAEAITDYGDLSVVVSFAAKTSTEAGDECVVRCTWVEFSTPDGPTTAQLQQELDDMRITRALVESLADKEEAAHAANPFRGWCYRLYIYRREYARPLVKALEEELEFRLGERENPPDVAGRWAGRFAYHMQGIDDQSPPTRDPELIPVEGSRVGVLGSHESWAASLPRGACG